MPGEEEDGGDHHQQLGLLVAEERLADRVGEQQGGEGEDERR